MEKKYKISFQYKSGYGCTDTLWEGTEQDIADLFELFNKGKAWLIQWPNLVHIIRLSEVIDITLTEVEDGRAQTPT